MNENQSTTEKITININVVELGYIDLLVSEGFYSNRTDFIKASIRRQLDSHAEDTKNMVDRKKSGWEVSVGIGGFTKSELEKIAKSGKRKKVIFVGLFILPKDIPMELLDQTIESIKVYGVCKCSNEVKKRYSL